MEPSDVAEAVASIAAAVLLLTQAAEKLMFMVAELQDLLV